MKVSAYSEKRATEQNESWYKTGENIKYFQNGIKKDPDVSWSKFYYTLTFQHVF